MTVETALPTVQTLVQVVGLVGGSYAFLRWHHQSQRQSQHLHVHGGSFDGIEVEEPDDP